MKLHNLARAASRVGGTLAWVVLPAAFLALMLAGSIGNHFAFDFHQFWQGGRDVLDGRSPYPPAESLPRAGDPSLDAVMIQDVYRFPYPAPAALAMVPFGTLPFAVAAAIFVALSVVAVLAALRVLGVSDPRCYGVVFLSISTLGAVRLGTFTPFLLLGLAVAWRYRNRTAAVAPVLAAVIVAKLFLWPLLVWLVLTRRFRAALLTVTIAGFVTFASWAAIGFSGLADYPGLLSSLSASVQGKGWSIVALGLSLHLALPLAKGLALALGGGTLALAARGVCDERAFALALVAALLLSPIVWAHYFLLLVAPLAIASPTLGFAWLAPLALWIWPFQETGGEAWRIALGLAVLVTVSAWSLRPARRGLRTGRAVLRGTTAASPSVAAHRSRA